jgi:N-acetylmuramoyl-L-alanine amidase
MAGPLPLKPEDVKYIAIHCSATPPAMDIGVPELDRMHRQRGFLSIGYHYVVRRDGTIQDGRPVTQRGAHVEDFNHCSIGICLVGGVDASKQMKPQANFTEDQLGSLKVLLGLLAKTYPTATVQGHRDFPHVAKACPSFNVRHWLDTNEVLP